jgi:LPS-assembly protein
LNLPGRKSLVVTLACLGISLVSLPAKSQEGEDPGAVSCPDPAIGTVLPPAPDRTASPVIIFARELDASDKKTGEARGNVELYRADQYLATERILYEPEQEHVTLPEPVSYGDHQVWIKGKQAEYSFLEESGSFTMVDYGLTGSSANGTADIIELEGGHTSHLRNIDYTTCPGERPDWLLLARELELRHEEGIGIARGAKLKFKGIPILYAPWFTFPIDERRKTGFLYPSFGNTNDNGFEFGIPFYWNIAANHDATIEPHYFTSRGFMLFAQYRFLTRRSSGMLETDWMPNDSKTDESRYHNRFVHSWRPWQRWRTDLVLDRVSDDQYFQDFGGSLFQTSRQFLRSFGALNGVGRYWTFEIMADDFQVIDEAVRPQNEPYRRVPRLGFWFDRPFGSSGFGASLESELVYFDRDFGTTGARLDLYPNLYWDRYSPWGFIKPTLGYRYTSYNLDNMLVPGNDSPERSTAIASLDAGLFFDRTGASGNSQTLEPRLYYLYVPYDDQDDLPDFDTGEFTFGFSQLFNTNRFAGADRQGDANQLSLALTTRSLSASTGQERWSFSIGQIIYFEPQRVRLNKNSELADDLSPFIAEFTWQPFNRFSARAGVQWNWERSRLDVGSFGVRYTGDRGERVGFEYRYRRERVDQFDFRIFWPINERWRVLSRVNYSFADDDMLEAQAGVEYESCCWAARLVLRRYLKNRDGDYRDGIFFELNLKGLASLGTRAQDLFRD